MSDETTTKPEGADENLALACQIASGETLADPEAQGVRVCGGFKNLNAKGRGDHWYRMVWRNKVWTYFSDERLPSGSFLASDRRADVKGDVFLGELVCQHDKGGPVDVMYLVITEGGDSAMGKMQSVEFSKRRDGGFNVTLPDGRTVVVVPNPRSR